MTTKRVIGLAAAALGATIILAGAANAAGAAPKLETLPTAGVQKVYYGGGYGGGYYRRCFRLPRRVIRMRLRMQGWRHIRHIRYVRHFGYGYGKKRCSFVATAKRRFGFGRFRLRGSARTGHVYSVRRLYARY
jgi:hypothetical protein